jgi:N-methylhydantoinase B
VSNTPIEVLEHLLPLEFQRKEITAGSGGAGAWPGGDGQVVECSVINSTPIIVTFLASRIDRPAEGLYGGEAGAVGSVLLNGQPINPRYRQQLQPGDRLTLTTPGGGGYGPGVPGPAGAGAST